jgi:hypothetical protein
LFALFGKKLIGRRFYLHVAYLWAVETIFKVSSAVVRGFEDGKVQAD